MIYKAFSNIASNITKIQIDPILNNGSNLNSRTHIMSRISRGTNRSPKLWQLENRKYFTINATACLWTNTRNLNVAIADLRNATGIMFPELFLSCKIIMTIKMEHASPCYHQCIQHGVTGSSRCNRAYIYPCRKSRWQWSVRTHLGLR